MSDFVRLSVLLSMFVLWSIYRSVCKHELKSGKTSVLDACVVRGGLGCGWGLDAPAHPSVSLM